MSLPMPEQRVDSVRQPDLFEERGHTVAPEQPDPPKPQVTPASLSDCELIAKVADADVSIVDGLCAEIVARSILTAVPALEKLWRRFHGFGIDKPLREQRAVLKTLAQLDCTEARTALKEIVLRPGLPASLLPIALPAAVRAGLVLPAAFVANFLDHEDDDVRGAAFDLALRTNVLASSLKEGLSDGLAPVRRAASIALAHLGDAAGKEVLITELKRSPSDTIIEALAAIGDDDTIVLLARCARQHRAFTAIVIEVLRDIDDPKAHRLADSLEADFGGHGLSGKVL